MSLELQKEGTFRIDAGTAERHHALGAAQRGASNPLWLTINVNELRKS
jgi:hypothetical protein